MAIDLPIRIAGDADPNQVSPIYNGKIEQIMYCHGFASNFDPNKDKVKALSSVAPVFGLTVDYTQHPMDVFAAFAETLVEQPSSLIVGTSMGGFFAAWLGSELGLPFVAINPAVTPATSLRKYIGAGMTHFGTTFHLPQDVVEAYADLPFRCDGDGEVVLDLGDEVIDAHTTIAIIGDRLPIVTFEGGSHRFEHMPELCQLLRIHFFNG